MLAIALIIMPVFGLIVVGYGARVVGLVADRTADGLSDFVFSLAVPCLIFKTLARAEIPLVQPWGYWIAYFGGVAVVWLTAMLIARRVFGLDGTEAVVAGFATGQANTVLVGIPMILRAYGEQGAVPLFLLIAVHLPVTMTVATLLAEGRGTSPLAIARRLALHPIIVSIALGAAIRLLPSGPPDVIWSVIESIATAAVPCALVGMGIALRRYGLEAGIALPVVVTALKLIAHPLIVYVLAFHVFTMPRAWAGVAVLFASAPSGINAYLFAERYKSGIAIASSSIALSTAFAIVTTVIWLIVLGVA
jgi:malonate transporter